MRIHLRELLLPMIQVGTNYTLEKHTSEVGIINIHGNINSNENVNDFIKQDALNAIKAIDDPTFHYPATANT